MPQFTARIGKKFSRCSARAVLSLLSVLAVLPAGPVLAFTLNEIPVCITTRLIGDVNSDCKVDIEDLTILNSNFGQSVPPHTLGDLDGNGFVDQADLSILVAHFGKTCGCENPNPPVCP
jgi:hypothetical protein